MSLESAKAAMQKQNPTATPGKSAGDRRRIPLSTPQRKLEIPEGSCPGYHLRWFRGTAARLQQAEAAGYEYVTPQEIQLNNSLLGGDAATDGNTDMGSRVSIVEGGEVDGGGNAIRLYLMKQKLEYKAEDDAVIEQRGAETAAALTQQFRSGTVGGRAEGETDEDAGQRYVGSRSRVPEFFRPKKRR